MSDYQVNFQVCDYHFYVFSLKFRHKSKKKSDFICFALDLHISSWKIDLKALKLSFKRSIWLRNLQLETCSEFHLMVSVSVSHTWFFLNYIWNWCSV